MTRLAILSAVHPYPCDAGKKVVLAGLVDYFTARLGAPDVHYLLIGGEPGSAFPAQLHPVPGPSARQAVTNVVVGSALGRASIQEAMLWSRRTKASVQRRLADIDAQIEVYDTVRTAQYADLHPGPRRICYLDDLFSQRYASMLAAVDTDRTTTFRPLGDFGRHVPKRLHSSPSSR
ncbi:hypothetical protein [Mycolicibacterium thermoresistibile]